jgi:two-component system phosphate regulon sensor histidine kinase PhoR
VKRAIFRRFILILLLALILSGSIFGAVISNFILDKTEDDMLYAIRIVDHGLDYENALKEQLDQLKKIQGNEDARFTVIGLDGVVVADSDVTDTSLMENHKNREEIKEALQSGYGYAYDSPKPWMSI